MPVGTIVIADDHGPTRRIVGELLRGDGWTVVEARDGVELLELASVYSPDAVVTDLAMPRMDGMQVARTLRERPEATDPLLIAITGRKLTREQEDELDHVFDHVIRKPVRPAELRRDLRAASDRGRRAERSFRK
jgi:CheY-like chemotaxis protein